MTLKCEIRIFKYIEMHGHELHLYLWSERLKSSWVLHVNSVKYSKERCGTSESENQHGLVFEIVYLRAEIKWNKV